MCALELGLAIFSSKMQKRVPFEIDPVFGRKRIKKFSLNVF
jgi:hypothetical protein